MVSKTFFPLSVPVRSRVHTQDSSRRMFHGDGLEQGNYRAECDNKRTIKILGTRGEGRKNQAWRWVI